MRFARYVVVGLLLSHTLGGAETPREEAARRTHEGLRLFEEKQFAEAEREFAAAYALSPQAGLLYDLGRVRAALGRHAEAAATLGRYAATLPNDEARVDVEAQAAEERALANAAAARAVAPASAVTEVPSRASRFPYPASVALGSVSLALGATSLGTGLSSQSIHDDLARRCATSCEAGADNRRGQALKVASIVTLALGGATVAGGAIAVALEHRQVHAEVHR